MNQSKIGQMQRSVEGLHKAKAKFKEKIAVSETLGEDLVWSGEVFVFELIYNTKASGASKEKIAVWQLGQPSSTALKAAENRGQKLKEEMQRGDAYKSNPIHRAKLAYAWAFDFDGADKQHVYGILHAGSIKTAADAVKSAYARDYAGRETAA